MEKRPEGTSEKLPEKDSTLENLGDQKYRELQEAMDEENHIIKEIDNVLTSTSDREEAEKIIFEKWAPLMDGAIKKTSEVQRAWLDAIRENIRAKEKPRISKIADIVHGIEKDFWVPAAFNGGIESFVGFVLENNLQEKFEAYNQNSDEDFSEYISRSCHEIEKDFWVPAVMSGGIGPFVQFCNKNSLWEKFREVI